MNAPSHHGTVQKGSDRNRPFCRTENVLLTYLVTLEPSTLLRDTSTAQLKGVVWEVVPERISAIKQALAEQGYGDVPTGDLLGALVSRCDAESAEEVEALFTDIRDYRRMSVGKLLRIPEDRASGVVELSERRVGRPRTRPE
jgi:nitrate reductase NapAB chaperone NapD